MWGTERRFYRKLLLCSALAAVPSLPTTSAAADAPFGLEEITVTAEKRSASIREVPQSMTALTGASLETLNAQSLQDFASLIPGLSFNAAGQGKNQITLRGITSGGNQANATVGVYVDDTPFGSSTIYAQGSQLTGNFDTFDIERIEVLRGPQGTLYGASTLGGLLKYVTKAPNFTETTARGLAEINSVDGGGIGFAVKGAVNVPINEKVAFRASAYRRNDAGFVDDLQRGADNVDQTRYEGGRLAIEFRPSDDISIRLSLYLQDVRSEEGPLVDLDRTTLRPLYGDLTLKRFLPEPFHARYRGVNATVAWDLGWASLTSATSYAKLAKHSASDVTASDGALISELSGVPVTVSFDNNVQLRKWTEELRLASPANQTFEWQVGAFVTHEQAGNVQTEYAFGPDGRVLLGPFGNPIVATLPSRYFEYAGFASATYHLTPELDITAGARWSRNEQHFTQGATGFFANPDDPAAGVLLRAVSSDKTWTYSIAPRWHVTPDVMLYARIASGYRPGGPNALIPQANGIVPSSFQADTLVNYEIGAKTEWLNRRLVADISAFYIDWSSVQLPASNGGFSFMSNGGAAESRGVELSVEYAPVAGLILSANAAYTYANLTQDAPGVGGAKGDRLPTVPRFGASFSAAYRTPLFGDYYGTVGGSIRHVGSRPSDYGVGRGRIELPAYNRLDLRAGIENGWLSATLFVENVTNERGILGAVNRTFDPVTSPITATIMRPRTIGLNATVNF